MLRCSGCQLDKPETDFYKEKYRARGYSVWCKECTLKRERIRRGKDPNEVKTPFDRKAHRQRNRSYYTAKSIERLRQKRRFKLTAEQFIEIVDIYTKAKAEGMVVDHIHPLNNKHVCGLHVPWNLQLLTAEENAKKHNKFDCWWL